MRSVGLDERDQLAGERLLVAHGKLALQQHGAFDVM
jgi:hypothetical protein